MDPLNFLFFTMATYNYEDGTVEETVILPSNGQIYIHTRPMTREESLAEQERLIELKWNWRLILIDETSQKKFDQVDQDTGEALSRSIMTFSRLLSAFHIHPSRICVHNMFSTAFCDTIEYHEFNHMGYGPSQLVRPVKKSDCTQAETNAYLHLKEAQRKCHGSLTSACETLCSILVVNLIEFENPVLRRTLLQNYEEANGRVPNYREEHNR